MSAPQYRYVECKLGPNDPYVESHLSRFIRDIKTAGHKIIDYRRVGDGYRIKVKAKEN